MKYLKLMTIGFLALLCGCREYSYYAFKRVDFNLWRGHLRIAVLGTYKDYAVEGKDYQDWANPYSLAFWYDFPNTERLAKFEVSEVVLTGLSSGNRLHLGEAESSKQTDTSKWPNRKDSGKIEMGCIISTLEKHQLTYEPYLLSCVVRLYADEKLLEEKKIEVKLETDFKTGKRSDAYDALMGI